MSDKPKQAVFHSNGWTLFERDGATVMRLEIKSDSDRKLIETRWIDGAGMGEIAQALEGLGYRV